MPKLLPTLLSLSLLAPSLAVAQPVPSFDAQRYRPAGNYHGFLAVTDGSVLPRKRFGFDVQLDFAFRPLQKLTSSQARDGGVIDALFAGHARVGFAPADWAQIDVGLAFMQFARGADGLSDIGGDPAQVFSLGDLWIEGRLRPLREDRQFVNLAFLPFLTFPTGNPNLYLTSGVPTFGASMAISKHVWRLHFAGTIGYRFKLGSPGYALLGDRVAADDELMYGVAAGIQPVADKLDVNFELFGSGLVGPGRGEVGDYPGKAGPHSPLEALINARVRLGKGFAAVFGGGWGVTKGVGTPAFRVIAGLSYAPAQDKDGDGLVDSADKCPEDPEDKDGFDDGDGCPDPDNDGDSVLDAVDACPLEAEDRDSWEDEDGCPEDDNDGDGVADAADACPLEAEDTDGFEDGDGCPDKDNDGDGVLDGQDSCPNTAEDRDGWQDEDGCPESDNDGDGFLDGVDLCPNEPEDKNGVKDDDGCPDSTLTVVKGDKILILEKVLFVTGKDVILKKSYPLLDSVTKTLLDHPELRKLSIDGHTDDRGSDASNQRLSEARATAIMRHLVKGGVDPGRLVAVGYGEARPIADNTTEDGRERNRRVEFTILEVAGGK